MKLLRYGEVGSERPGLLDDAGIVRDLSGYCADIDFGQDPDLIERLAALSPTTLPKVEAPVRLGPPLTSVQKFIAIGLNYRDHAIESDLAIPDEPLLFMKANSCISGPNDPIMLPPQSKKADWEVELGIVIARRAKHVTEAEAEDHIAGYLIVNDMSEREYQLERGGVLDKGKGYDRFGPIGPWLVTKNEVPNCQALEMQLDVNGQPMQRGNTKEMIFPCVQIVSYVSQFMTLVPGDIITTGTPAGVGMGRKPQIFLKDGDVVTARIAGLGEQSQRIRKYESANP